MGWCRRCLCPPEEFLDSKVYPQRRKCLIGTDEQKSGLRSDLKNALFDIEFCDPFIITPFDPSHTFDSGIGKNMFKLVISMLKDCYNNRKTFDHSIDCIYGKLSYTPVPIEVRFSSGGPDAYRAMKQGMKDFRIRAFYLPFVLRAIPRSTERYGNVIAATSIIQPVQMIPDLLHEKQHWVFARDGPMLDSTLLHEPLPDLTRLVHDEGEDALQIEAKKVPSKGRPAQERAHPTSNKQKQVPSSLDNSDI